MKKYLGKIRIAIQLSMGALLVAGGLTNLPITLLIILVTTVLAGPLFCGWTCPFGTLQDLISKLSTGVKKHKMPRPLQKVMAFTRYILMAVTTLLTFDFIFSIMQFDPRINFLSMLHGKILTSGAYIVLGIYLVIAIFFERPFCNGNFGLGLAIVQKVVKGHGWEIRAYNLEKGVCFELDLKD